MLTRRNLLATAVTDGIVSALAPAKAQQFPNQPFPNRPIKLIVPFPAGGANDTIARLVAQQLSSSLGQPVLIENQAGAGGTIGARSVANASPDGHTLLMGAVSTICISPLLYRLDYDPAKAFAPVAPLATEALAFVASPAVPASSMAELIQHAKAKPGSLNYGSAIGIGPHLMMEMFKRRAGVDIVHVPYRGGAPMITDLIGGQIQLTINNKSVLLPHIMSGKLKALAVTSATRWPELPDVPTFRDTGFADIPSDAWFGVLAPAQTPAPVVDRLSSAISDGLQSDEVRAGFAKLGIEARIGNAREFAALIADEVPRWAAIVKVTGVKID
jgi:tripartite-type tricarboxylate transporter receptor subunit TctC